MKYRTFFTGKGGACHLFGPCTAVWWVIFYLFPGFFAGIFLVDARADLEMEAVDIEYFYETGCNACAAIDSEVLPEVETSFPGLFILTRRDTADIANYEDLLKWEKRLGFVSDAPVVMIIDRHRALVGLDSVRKDLIPAMEAAIVAKLNPVVPDPESPAGASEQWGGLLWKVILALLLFLLVGTLVILILNSSARPPD